MTGRGSTPAPHVPVLLDEVVSALDGLGGATRSERAVATEDVYFKLPPELRKER